MNYIKSLLIAFAIIHGAIAMAQPTDVGPIVSYEYDSVSVKGRTSNAIFEVRAYSDEIIRVRITKNNGFREFSYMLTEDLNDLRPRECKITAQGDSITMSTDKIIVEIGNRPSFAVAFKDRQGHILNEDDCGKGFGTTYFGNKVTSYKKLHDGERFVGLGEALGNLDRRGSVVTLQNTDTFRYGDARLPMYANVPFYIGILEDRCYGIFYHNSYKGVVNFGAGNVRFMSISHEGGDADYFFFHDDTPAGIIDDYTMVTGRCELPPLWSLGFHQSRCSYYNERQVREIARNFRSRGIPLDCIVLDADYLVDYKPFVIDKERFPDMAGLSKELRKDGIRLTASVNPGISTDEDYEPIKSAKSEDVLLKYPDGNYYIAPIDPNINCYVDFTLPAGRDWWERQMKVLSDNGISGYWNDMNEPAVSQSVVPDNVIFNFEGNGSTALEAKNLYGMLMARSSYEAGINNVPNERPFVLTRSGFAGVQRYSAVWSGDNTACSEHILLANLLNCQMGISGIPFTGADIGGFIGDGSKELYARWIESGVFYAFARSHRIAFGSGNEPWSYGEIPEGIAKTYIDLRYRLLPYIYSNFKESTLDGMPLCRSLCITDPYDARCYDDRYQYQFLFGPSVLVIPAIPEDSETPIFLPHGEWYDIYSDAICDGSVEMRRSYPEYELPLFVRSSAIIPMQSSVLSTAEQPSDTLYIHLYNGKDRNIFNYYEDDGISFSYKQGAYHSRTIEWDGTRLKFGRPSGNANSKFRKVCIILHGFGDDVKASSGKDMPVSSISDVRLFDPTGNILCYYEKRLKKAAEKQCSPIAGKCVTFDYPKGEFQISIF